LDISIKIQEGRLLTLVITTVWSIPKFHGSRGGEQGDGDDCHSIGINMVYLSRIHSYIAGPRHIISDISWIDHTVLQDSNWITSR